MIPAGYGVLGIALDPVGKRYTAMQAPVLDRIDLAAHAIEQNLLSQELDGNGSTFGDFAREANGIPMVSEPEFRTDVRLPNLGSALGD